MRLPSLTRPVPTVTEPAGALLAASVRVFRHEFLTIFRFSHRARVHPADLRVLERLDGAVADADADTVFLARGAMERMQRLVVQAQAQADGVRRVQAQAHGAGMRHPYAHPLLHPYQAAPRPGRLAVH